MHAFATLGRYYIKRALSKSEMGDWENDVAFSGEI